MEPRSDSTGVWRRIRGTDRAGQRDEAVAGKAADARLATACLVLAAALAIKSPTRCLRRLVASRRGRRATQAGRRTRAHQQAFPATASSR